MSFLLVYTDGSSHVYMNGTARFYFANGSSKVKINSTLQNAQYGTSNTFATAFKAIQASEFRLGSALSGTLNWNIGNHTGVGSPTTGTMSGSDTVFLYQGASTFLQDSGGWSSCASPCTQWTIDQGYTIKKNGSALQTGTVAQVPVGYAEIDNGTAGVQIGGFLLGANGPKSLEFQTGGTGTDSVRIGLYSAQNSTPVTIAWPQHHTEEFYLNFFAALPSSVPSAFLRQQHPLVARASFGQYNSSGVLFYSLEDPSVEDPYYNTVVTGALPSVTTTSGCANGVYTAYNGSGCIRDVGTTQASFPMFFYPGEYNADLGGGRDQLEWRYSWLTNWWNRGMTGRLMQVKQFEMMAGDTEWPRADFSGGWRGQSTSVLSSEGQPTATSSLPAAGTCNTDATGTIVTLTAGSYFQPWYVSSGINKFTINGTQYSSDIASINSSTQLTMSVSVGTNLTGVTCQYTEAVGNTELRYWPDAEHRHWWGIEDWYFYSGDQHVLDDIHNTTTSGIFDDYNLNLVTTMGAANGGSNNGTGNTNAGAGTLTLATGTVAPEVVGGPISITISGVTNIYKMTNITGTPNVVTLSPISPAPAIVTATGVSWSVQSGVFNTRSTGEAITAGARYSQFLASLGDTTDSPTALLQAQNLFAMQVNTPLCASGYPAGCTVANSTSGGPYHTQGVSTTRGFHYNNGNASENVCGGSNDYRVEGDFQVSILDQGLWELAQVAGTSWSGYQATLDMAYGLSQYERSEGSYYNSASNRWQTGVTSAARSGSSTVTVTTNEPIPLAWTQVGGVANIASCSISAYNQTGVTVTATGANTFTYAAGGSGTDSATGCKISVGGESYIGNGMRYYVVSDIAQPACDDTLYPVRGNQTVWMPYFVAANYDGYVSTWSTLVSQTEQMMMSGNPIGVGGNAQGLDVGGYQLQALVNAIQNPPANQLQTQTITSFVDHGGGSYTIGWTTPAGSTNLRAKWGALNVVDWIGYDPVAEAFSASICSYAALGSITCSGSPSTTQAWFASTEVPSMPAPVAGTQTVTVSTGTTGLVAANFMVKAMAPPFTPPTTYTGVSGFGVAFGGSAIH